MVPPVSAARAASDALACMGLGLLAALMRCMLPLHGRAVCFWSDFFCCSGCLILVQGFAACRGGAGVLRWYLLAGAAAGAVSGEVVLRAVRRRAARALQERVAVPLCRAGRFLLCPLQNARTARKTAQKKRKVAENLTRQSKKRLQNRGVVLYNSNVSTVHFPGEHPAGR